MTGKKGMHGKTPEERFWEKVEKTDSCWFWTAATNEDGYGRFRVASKLIPAHCFSYQLLVGPIPLRHHLDHQVTCPKNCVRPDHLRPVTHKQNQENRLGVRGVYLGKHGKWHGRVIHHGKTHWAGTFVSSSEAEAAVVALRNQLFTHNDSDRMVS